MSALPPGRLGSLCSSNSDAQVGLELADHRRVQTTGKISCMRLHSPRWKRAGLGLGCGRGEAGRAPEKEAIWVPADARFPAGAV